MKAGGFILELIFMFHLTAPTYQESSGGSVTLRDARMTKVIGKGRVDLKMTSRKTLTLHNVIHVPSVRRNLVSSSLLVKASFKIEMESNKIVLTKTTYLLARLCI